MLRRVIAWLPFVLLTCVLLGWLWRLLLGETLFWGLPALQFYPWRSYAFDELRAGRLPLWNPYNGGGAPLLANYQTAVFYPPNWLHLILPHVAAMNILAVGHIVWAAVGMWLFAAAWKLPDFGRGISALAFALSGYLIARLGSFPTVAAASWLPWLFLGVHRLVTARRLRDGALLALVTGMLLLAGHAQTAYYALLGTSAYILWLGWRTQHGRARLVAWGMAALAVILGAGLAAIQLFPTLELLSVSDRANGLSYAWTTNFSYSLVRALNLLSPNIFGTPADGSYMTEGVYFEDAAYVGLLPLVAACFGVVVWIRQRRAPDRPAALDGVPFWVGMAALAFLIALGKNGPLFPLLYQFVPTFTAFQGPVRWLILVVFALSLLAGIGVSDGWCKGKWVVFWSRLIAAGGIGMAVVAAFLAPRILPPGIPELETLIGGFVTLGLFASGCALLTLLQPDDAHPHWRVPWQMAVLVFVAFDLFWASRGLNPTVPAEFFRPVNMLSGEGDMLYMAAAAERRLEFEEFFRVDDYRVAVERWPELRTSLLPNLNLIDRVPMFNNFDPILTETYARAVDALEADLPDDALFVTVPDLPRQEPFGERALMLGALVSGLSFVLCLGLGLAGSGHLARSSGSAHSATMISNL